MKNPEFQVKYVVIMCILQIIGVLSCDKKKAPVIQSTAVGAPDWTSLETKLGEYPSQTNFYENSVISHDLKKILGEKFIIFKTNMEKSTPISKEGVLFVTGQRDENDNKNAGYIIMDPATRHLEVGLWSEGKFCVYANSWNVLSKPDKIRTMIQNSWKDEPYNNSQAKD